MDQSNRPHRTPREKKKNKHTGDKNPKAFAFANPGKLARQAKRSHDLNEKKLHVPMVDRLPEEAPPIVVAVVGPPGTGKTTLIKSLVRRYTKHTLTTIAGPITVVTSKKRRLTFMECDASLPAMIDTAKIADIVLLLIDGNFGFEMETMEFLNVLSSHGMPSNIFGILTHLDLFKSPSILKTTKKRLKHRFWSELYQGAKLFYLSGVINGRYPDREVLNLSRFISVMKNPRPLVWRNAHPYMLADRMVDLTDPTLIEKDAKCDRQVALYGYLRGTNFPAVDGRVHVPGVGDLTVSNVEGLVDPCPTPQATLKLQQGKEKKGRRRLGDKQKLLYAPMSDVGGVLVDKDAVYIDVRTTNFDAEVDLAERSVGERLVVGLQGRQGMLGVEQEGGIKLFHDSGELQDDGRKTKRTARTIDAGEQMDDEGFESGSDEENEEFQSGDEEIDGEEGTMQSKPGRMFMTEDDVQEDVAFASDSEIGSVSDVSDQELDDGSDLEDEEEEEEKEEDQDEEAAPWKDKMALSMRKQHGSRKKELSRILYDDNISPTDVLKQWHGLQTASTQESTGDEDDFFKIAEEERADDLSEDQSMPSYDFAALEAKWKVQQDQMEDLRRRFITADLLGEKEDAENANASDDEFSGFSDEGDGEFEDLETGEKVEAEVKPPTLEQERAANARKKEELRLRFEEEDREGLQKNELEGDKEFGEDEWYDAQKAKISKQLEVNKAELEELELSTRVRVEGFRPGTYARLVLSNVPAEFVTEFNPRYPVLVGGLTPTEDRFGFLQVRIKRHRWHKKILKTNDPLIFSLGWRRFQSIPIYSLSDSRTRNRMLKYTPEHMHCFGTFYGPLIAPNTGFCCVQSVSANTPGFRIAATGVVLNVNESTEIVKKLKLTGAPVKIYKNTAFIKDMFSSSLEIAKFEGASIKTVSGIRGQIKRALAKPEGHFRATFEDKILMSDIVFLRAWYPVKPRKFYNPVTTLLGEEGFKAMRTTGQVRYEDGVKTPLVANSAYRKIERPTRHFNPLRVPKAVAASLPFASQIHKMKPQRSSTYLQKRAAVLGGEDKKARDLLQKLQTMRNEKVAKRSEKKEEKRKVYRAKVKENTEMKEARERKENQEYWRKEGKKRKGGEDGAGRFKKRKSSDD